MKKFMLLVLILLIIPISYSKEYHMYLLAVSENTQNPQGMVADLYLEIKPGTGRVFMDTFPLTKVDTQISTRFAKSMACKYLETDCSNKDFFYTIRSNAMIIGGPSAGGALTVLTVAALQKQDIDEQIALTGTINSGGLIGPVGAIDHKIDAALKANISKVLIPRGERYIIEQNNKTNITKDLYQYGIDNGISVKEISTLDEAMYEFTGIVYEKEYENLTISPFYEETMKDISDMLCSRTQDLRQRVMDINSSNYKEAENLSMKSMHALKEDMHYSRASYCFGANIRLSYQLLIEENPDMDEIDKRIRYNQKTISEFNEKADNIALETITDLQTYEIVKERLIEAEEYLKTTAIKLGQNNTDDALYFLSYGIERYNSAISWSEFFSKKGKKLVLNQEALRNSCIEKLSEAEERYQYVQLYMPLQLMETRKQLQRAYDDLNNEDYELCLFKASKSKAEADVLLGLFGVTDEQLSDHFEIKLKLVEKLIYSQQQKGMFPILGYSYFEYAKSLSENDRYSSLLYLEYALELSNLDIYFETHKSTRQLYLDSRMISVFILGSIFGILIGLMIKQPPKKGIINIKIKNK